MFPHGASVGKNPRYRVVVPRWTDDDGEETRCWTVGRYSGESFLTSEGLARLRELVRIQERWRLERRDHWVIWIIAPAGLIGMLTGLLAVWKANP